MNRDLKTIKQIFQINKKTTIAQLRKTCKLINKQKISDRTKSEYIGLCFKRLNGGL